ncbi:hypothetical protein A2382_05015 [Candidatus Woesebacteria bacterium RIFOXYB1_FULL_38_16]|uniref:HTH cro/C1-type domain-containing protein n=1 Tax=Candidatus Woesebacteria bacterium RIFOXYB1_FULL_38_16 TaxID=1802538 RepID=A0A1F8CUM6_9BACT|nr:MAG: hypothetical protein A2191_00145 [Candidatus Woesebacteria bacterium RIFOXYA1_FULL_38_9]OGM80017.1 MAG: hypothetical protein A2382_05015 [Candidatus Woesebacteria bacterium RIFOXYB1_FULL_38_16]
MITVGRYLKEERVKQGKLIAELSRETRIKMEFIKAIEKENWTALPDYSVVVGFVKNLASYLDLDRERAVALLRRDYVHVKKEVGRKSKILTMFKWNPQMTFGIGFILIILTLLGYLGYQYYRFTRPPKIEIIAPSEEQVIYENELYVYGIASKGASVEVNEQPAQVDENGNFSTIIKVLPETSSVRVVAKSRMGKEMVVERKIIVSKTN